MSTVAHAIQIQAASNCMIASKTVTYTQCLGLAWLWHKHGGKKVLGSSCSAFMSLASSSLIHFLFPILFLFLSPPPYVMSSHLSLSTGGKPEPLACCQLERGWGYILLADAKWTGPLPHNAHYWKTFGNGRWHGGGQKRDRVLVRTRPLCHLTWHIKTAALHQCSSGLIHS